MVADGPPIGKTIRQLLEQSPERLLGKFCEHFSRFQTLLKFLDVTKKLSVHDFREGDVLLLPAEIGACACHPRGAASILEVLLPDVA